MRTGGNQFSASPPPSPGDEATRGHRCGKHSGADDRDDGVIVAHAGLFAAPLLEAIIEQLKLDCSGDDAKRLNVLKQALAWQRTVGGMRL